MEQQERCVLFDCPRCSDEFRVDYQKIAELDHHWRIRVRCPRCGNTVEVVKCAFKLIQNSNPDEYQAGEITEILPPDSKFEDMLKKRRQGRIEMK